MLLLSVGVPVELFLGCYCVLSQCKVFIRPQYEYIVTANDNILINQTKTTNTQAQTPVGNCVAITVLQAKMSVGAKVDYL